MQCQPSCQRFIQNDETALSSETGFYWKFESDPVTGRPFGCPGFDKKWLEGISRKDFKKKPRFDPITFTFSGNSNYGQESLLEV